MHAHYLGLTQYTHIQKCTQSAGLAINVVHYSWGRYTQMNTHIRKLYLIWSQNCGYLHFLGREIGLLCSLWSLILFYLAAILMTEYRLHLKERGGGWLEFLEIQSEKAHIKYSKGGHWVDYPDLIRQLIPALMDLDGESSIILQPQLWNDQKSTSQICQTALVLVAHLTEVHTV